MCDGLRISTKETTVPQNYKCSLKGLKHITCLKKKPDIEW